MTIESQVFINGGHWRNFEHLEEELTMEELTALAKAVYDQRDNDRKFLAAIQGIDLYKDGKTDDDDDDEESYKNDITRVKGYRAELEGFGVGQGLSYEVEGE